MIVAGLYHRLLVNAQDDCKRARKRVELLDEQIEQLKDIIRQEEAADAEERDAREEDIEDFHDGHDAFCTMMDKRSRRGPLPTDEHEAQLDRDMRDAYEGGRP